MAQKRNSTWRPPPFWVYFRWLFLTYSRLYTIAFNHHTKFRADISIHDRIIITFLKFNSSWNCCIIIMDHPRSLWLGLHQSVKFYGNRMHSLKICGSDFLLSWLEMPIHARKNRFFWAWTDKRDWSSSRLPKVTSAPKTTCYVIQFRPYLWPVGETKEFVCLFVFV